MANITGPDISFYQDDPQTPQGVNFTKMRESAPFVIVRAGQNLWGDRDFKANWNGAKAAGLPRGSYWFYDSRIDPKLQAEKWASMFEGDFGELPHFGDFEDAYNGPYKGWKHWHNFLERFKQLLPANKEIGVYTGYYYWRENTVAAGMPAASLNYFKQYPLWIAAYNPTAPLIPKPWDHWTFWQFTDNGDGVVHGVESLNIDLNYFNGDLAAFEQRFGVVVGPPTPPPPPGKNYRVTVASLKVREGPGLSFNQLGSVKLNEVVERLDVNPDNAWLKIRKLDGSLTGWSFAAYLQNISGAVEPPPDDGGPGNEIPPPDDEDVDWYRVTASSLKIRTGPGLEYDSIGTFTFGELVKKLDASPNNEWLKVRSKDGSKTGWCFGEYLLSVHDPSEEPPQATPVPEYGDKNWYRVNTSTLNLREAPSQTSRIIGAFSKNDIVPALDDASNPQWAQTQKMDGATGWVSKGYLVQVSAASRPSSIAQNLFPGVTYLRKDLASPRPIVVHVLAIDLQAQKLEFLVTPSSNNTDVLCARTTPQFLEEFKLHAAINGGYFSYLDANSFPPKKVCPNGGDPVRISDYAASRGKVYSPKKTAQPVVHIAKKNQVQFNKEPGQVFNAVSGDRMVVTDGKVVKNLAAQVPNPRTAIGLSKNGRWLTLMVVDGRQTGYSEGVTFPELAELLISYGVHTGANMDGGGSSTMALRGFDGKARVLNSPIEMNQPGRERPVGNHLGLFIKA